MKSNLKFTDDLNDNLINDIKRKSKNTSPFMSPNYKILSSIADKKIHEYNLKYSKMYSKI